MTDAGDLSAQTLVIIPTYNERENLPKIVGRLHAALPAAHVLVVDDGSPDGTGEIADEMAAEDKPHRRHAPHREERSRCRLHRGFPLGSAARLQGARRDGRRRQSRPGTTPAAAGGGRGGRRPRDRSRYVPGGKVVNWPKRRELLSKGGNLYSRLALGVKVHDITGGYRAYRRSALECAGSRDGRVARLLLPGGPGVAAHPAGAKVTEVPITFTEREIGESKMSGNIVREALVKVTVWGVRDRYQRVRAALRKCSATRAVEPGVMVRTSDGRGGRGSGRAARRAAPAALPWSDARAACPNACAAA